MPTPETLARTPLITPEGLRLLERLREHPDAPRWTYAAGDRLVRADLDDLAAFRAALATGRAPRAPGASPPPPVLALAAAARERVPFYRDRIPAALDLERDFAAVPTTSRADLALAPEEFVPDDADLDRLVLYRTAGTTGHPISVPQHPRAIACYAPLLELALARHGARLRPVPDAVACFLVSAQIRTYTYATVLSAWGGAGFAKLNLRPTEWPRPESARCYFEEFAPPLLTGDPIAFAELLATGLPARPVALVSTSVALNPDLRQRLAAAYACPVIDWYSLVETGPIGYSCPAGAGFHVLPADLHVEAVRPDGTPAMPGERGEIAVTGGRNPYLPLLRYRTGDFGALDSAPCPCGDPAPRVIGLEGRQPLLFRAADGTPVSTVDLSRLLREFPLLVHVFTQRADRSCELLLRPLPAAAALDLERIRGALVAVLGAVGLEVRIDPRLGEDHAGKTPCYRSELAP